MIIRKNKCRWRRDSASQSKNCPAEQPLEPRKFITFSSSSDKTESVVVPHIGSISPSGCNSLFTNCCLIRVRAIESVMKQGSEKKQDRKRANLTNTKESRLSQYSDVIYENL